MEANNISMNVFMYGKKESSIIAGIAVMLMMFHHTFGFYEWQLSSIKYYELFLYKDITLERIIASYGKICVAIFAFNSGYALWVNKEKNNIGYILKKIIVFLVGYWISIAFFLIYANITCDNIPDINTVIYNLIGLKTGPSLPYVNVPFAWYVLFYIIFLLFSPVIIALFKFKNVIYDILLLIILYYICSYIFGKYNFPILEMFFSVGVNSFMGYVFAKHNIFTYIKSIVGTKTYVLLSLLLLSFILRPAAILICENYHINIPYDIVFAPIFIYIFITVTTNLLYVNKVLIFIGGISMNLWFFHGIFFTGGGKDLQPLVYFPKISLFIIIWEIILLIPVCLLCKFFQKKITSFIKR